MDEIEDETLMAYADGELSPRQRAALETRLRNDGDARERLRAFRDSRELLERYAEDLLRLPVPDALRETVRRGPTPTAAPERRRDRRRPRRTVPRRDRYPGRPAAVAASLALLFGTGYLGLTIFGDKTPSRPDAPIPADAVLSIALESTPSGVGFIWPPDAAEPRQTVVPLLSFRDQAGRICRQYERSRAVPDRRNRAATLGVACRSLDGHWLTEMETARPPANRNSIARNPPQRDARDEYLPAAGAAAGPVETLIDRLIADEPLSSDQERALVESGWRDR